MPAKDTEYRPRRAPGSVDVVTLGELLVDFVPAPAGTPRTPDSSGPVVDGCFMRAAGGAPANVAMALAKLGTGSAFVGTVGDDPFGRFLVGELDAADVCTAAVALVPQLTALAFVTLGDNGEREFVFYRQDAAHDQLTPVHVDSALAGPLLSDARILHLGSNGFAVEPAAAASWRALEVARGRGLAVSFDVNYRADFWPDGSTAKRAINEVLPHAAIVKVSLEELEFLSGESSRAAAERFAAELLDSATRLLCVTLGPAGAWYYCAAGSGEVAAPRVTAVDTTGAGDAFVAALLAAANGHPELWSDKRATHQALRRACAYAAFSTTAPGAGPSYLNREEFERRLAHDDAGNDDAYNDDAGNHDAGNDDAGSDPAW